MVQKNKVPDAWDDDDWEAQADKLAKNEPQQQQQEQKQKQSNSEPVLTSRERLAKHQEEMRKIWETADAPPPEVPTYYLPSTTSSSSYAAAGGIPLASPMKPAVKLLSRKPAPRTISRRDPVTGLEQLVLQDVDDDEDQDSRNKKIETPEEIRRRQQLELEEKKRRYEEARAKIFAESNANNPSSSSAGRSTPPSGNITPPQHMSEGGRQGSRGGRGRGRGRGGGGGGGGRGDFSNNNSRQQQQQQQQERRQQQSAETQIESQPPTRQLYDPNYSPRSSGATTPRRYDGSPQIGSRSHTPLREEEQIIRSPRGPDSSGRGGFGFSRRGGGGSSGSGGGVGGGSTIQGG